MRNKKNTFYITELKSAKEAKNLKSGAMEHYYTKKAPIH